MRHAKPSLIFVRSICKMLGSYSLLLFIKAMTLPIDETFFTNQRQEAECHQPLFFMLSNDPRCRMNWTLHLFLLCLAR